MKPHEQRMVDEQAELTQRLSDLRVFIGTPEFDALPFEERVDQCDQVNHMSAYSAVLGKRIRRFEQPTAEEALQTLRTSFFVAGGEMTQDEAIKLIDDALATSATKASEAAVKGGK